LFRERMYVEINSARGCVVVERGRARRALQAWMQFTRKQRLLRSLCVQLVSRRRCVFVCVYVRMRFYVYVCMRVCVYMRGGVY
jgi:hypothetical protein